MNSRTNTEEQHGEDKGIKVNRETQGFPSARHFIVAGNLLKQNTVRCDISKSVENIYCAVNPPPLFFFDSSGT